MTQPFKTDTLNPFQPHSALTDPTLYRPGEALTQAADVAIHLGQPLLLTGEPGTGKTQFAHYLAKKYQQDTPLVFNTQTTSSARDLFYRYDALGHLNAAQHQTVPFEPDEIEQRFIDYQALGQAIHQSRTDTGNIKGPRRAIVLIDEIDKAPRDFPNDLLTQIEAFSFDVPEIRRYQIKGDSHYRPVVIITSNSEQNLPDAFLRRCVYFHLAFPDPDTLLALVSERLQSQHYSHDDYQRALIPHFMTIRNRCQSKKPATAELLYWLVQLEHKPLPVDCFKTPLTELTDEQLKHLKSTYSVLIKSADDWQRVVQENQ